MYSIYSDPRKIIEEREIKTRCCPVCAFNVEHKRHKNGWKEFKCAWGHDQEGGTKGQANCKDFARRANGSKIR